MFAVGSPVPFDYSSYGAGVFVGGFGFRMYGDPFVACRDFYVSLLPGACRWDYVGVCYARFYVRDWVRYPSYLCYGGPGLHVRVGDGCRPCDDVYVSYRESCARPGDVFQPVPRFKSVYAGDRDGYQARAEIRTSRVDRVRPTTFKETREAPSHRYTAKQVTKSTAENVADYTREADKLAARRAATKQSAEALAQTKKTLGKEQAKVDAKLAEAKKLLGKLEAEERARLDEASRDSSARLPNVPVSGRAAAAVNYALAQVGDAYVYGAAGPNAFDCSGLTMMAWAQAGVGLPHSSSAQQGSGSPVSSSNLQPGDLVFYYSPVSHVGIYIGGGKIVHAANPGTGVTVAGVFSMPYSGAVRPG